MLSKLIIYLKTYWKELLVGVLIVTAWTGIWTMFLFGMTIKDFMVDTYTSCVIETKDAFTQSYCVKFPNDADCYSWCHSPIPVSKTATNFTDVCKRVDANYKPNPSQLLNYTR